MKLFSNGREILCSASYGADSRSNGEEKLLRDCCFALKPLSLLPDMVLQGVKCRGIIGVSLEQFANSSIRQLVQYDVKVIFRHMHPQLSFRKPPFSGLRNVIQRQHEPI